MPRGRAGMATLRVAIFVSLDREQLAQADSHLRIARRVGRAYVPDVDDLADDRRRAVEDDDSLAEDQRLVDRVLMAS
mgnify:CR=1 FL=1